MDSSHTPASSTGPVPQSRPLSPTAPPLGTELRDSAVLLALTIVLLAVFAAVASTLVLLG